MPRISGTVHRQNPVEMVHLMLNQLRERAHRFKLVVPGIRGLVAEAHPARPFHPCHQVREGETVVPKLKAVSAFPTEFRIDELIADAFEFEEDHPAQIADLDRADAPAEAMKFAKCGKRRGKILDKGPGFGGFGNRQRNLAQGWVAELKNSFCRHDFMVPPS